jgi:hypothetical protein
MATKNLNEIFPKEFVEQRTREYEIKELEKKKSTYWEFLGELGFFMGFDAVRAVLDDYIELKQARELLNGARTAYYGTVYDSGVAVLAGSRANFEKTIGFYKRNM